MGTKAANKLFSFYILCCFILLAAVTIAGGLAVYTDPNKHPIISYLGVILPGLLIVNFLFFIIGLSGKKKWAFIPLVAILTNFEFILSMVNYTMKTDDTKASLRVATYNVRAFNMESTGYSAKQIALFMVKQKIDIICFQEYNANGYFTRDSLLTTFYDYPYHYIPTFNKGTRIAIFSKHPITDTLAIPFPGSMNCGMRAIISIKGKKISVFNVHMQTTSLNSSRRKLAKQMQYGNPVNESEIFEKMNQDIIANQQTRVKQACLVSRIIEKNRKMPTLLCGDFNDTPASYTYHLLRGELKDGFRTCGRGYAYTYRGLLKMLRIDYIFHSKDLKGIQYFSPSLTWSDHNPVIMEIQYP